MMGFRLWVASSVPVFSPLPVFSDRPGFPGKRGFAFVWRASLLDDVCAA